LEFHQRCGRIRGCAGRLLVRSSFDVIITSRGGFYTARHNTPLHNLAPHGTLPRFTTHHLIHKERDMTIESIDQLKQRRDLLEEIAELTEKIGTLDCPASAPVRQN
jgi:hypothetical protein